MKISMQHLKIVPLTVCALAAVAILIMSLLNPASPENEEATSQAPRLRFEEAVHPKEAKDYGDFSLDKLIKEVPRTKEGYFKLQVIELFYTNGDLNVKRVLSEQIIETSAQVTVESSKGSPQPLIKVFQIGPDPNRQYSGVRYSVPLEFEKKPPALKENEWVRVVGKPIYKDENGINSMSLKVTEINITGEPSQDKTIY